jgi:hypothetical protein
MAMIAITTSNSIRVKPERERVFISHLLVEKGRRIQTRFRCEF